MQNFGTGTRWLLGAAIALALLALGFVGRNLISPPQGVHLANGTQEMITKIDWHYESKYSGAWVTSRSTLRLQLAPGQSVFLSAPGSGEFGYEISAETASGKQTVRLTEGYALGRQSRTLVPEKAH